jgi:hypothetical protein
VALSADRLLTFTVSALWLLMSERKQEVTTLPFLPGAARRLSGQRIHFLGGT